MKKNTTAQISSLLATSAARHQEAEEVQPVNWDKFFIGLGKQALAQYQAGEISREMFWGLIADYKAKLNELRGQQ